jgi:hypothetical protein
LTSGDYLSRNDERQDNQVAAARWQFVEAIRCKVPVFFERLRDVVYPAYERFANGKPRYWERGWRFDTWQVVSDHKEADPPVHPDNQLTPILLTWAREFNVNGETWILEGALQTLSDWHKSQESKEALDIWGFREWYCVPGLITPKDHGFKFEDGGWDPTFWRWEDWLPGVTKRFEESLLNYRQKMSKLIEQRGADRSAARFSAEHFEWLALYQCGNLSLDLILSRAPNVGDKSTVSKGMKHAAKLANISIRPKRLKLKSQ